MYGIAGLALRDAASSKILLSNRQANSGMKSGTV